MASWRHVKTFLFRHEADLAKALLQSYDIEAQLKINDGGSLYPQLNFTAGIEILVREEDFEAAQRILSGHAA